MDRQSGLKALIGAILLAAWVVMGTIGFTMIEGWSVVDALYMTVITISTVGFKEAHPLSDAGKVFAIFIIVGGLGTAGYVLTRAAPLLLEGDAASKILVGDTLVAMGQEEELKKLERVCGRSV